MKKILLFSFLCIIGVGIGIYLFGSAKQHPLTQTEKEAAIAKLLGHQPILSNNPRHNIWIEHRGKYVSFAYPQAATVYRDTVNPPDKNSLESFVFQQESPRYFFVTEVLDPTNVETYNDIPSVLLRRNNKNQYTETSMALQNVTFPVFTKTQQNVVEKTAFILANGKEYTFSITSANPDVISIFDRVMASVKILH